MKSLVSEVKLNMPSSLLNENYMLPMPIYDSDGVFKSYLHTHSNFSHTRNSRQVLTFDYNKLMNQSITDSVFETFVQKAKDMEQAAGNPVQE